MLEIDLDAAMPLVEQIRGGIRQAIAAGDLRSGDPLPTVRQLGQDLGVNLNTIARAYRQLESEGLVVTQRRRGTFVRSQFESLSPRSSAMEKVTNRAREFFTDARLAGLSRPQVEELVDGELRRLWIGGEG